MHIEPSGWIEIEHCQARSSCMQRWDRLEPIRMPSGSTDVARFCSNCQRTVFLSRDADDYHRHSSLGRCVAQLPVSNLSVDRLEVIG